MNHPFKLHLDKIWNKLAGPSTIAPGSDVNGVKIIEPPMPMKKMKKMKR